MKALIGILTLILMSAQVWADRIGGEEACVILADSTVGEENCLFVKAPQRARLEEWIKGRPLVALDEIRGIPEGSKQIYRFILYAAEKTTDEEFFDLTLEVLRLYSEGEVNKEALQAVLMPPDEKAGLLDVRFRDARIQALLKLVLKKLPPDDPFYIGVQKTLSGEAAKAVSDNGQNYYSKRYVSMAAEALKEKKTRNGSSNSNTDREDSSHLNAKVWPWVFTILVVSVIVGVYFRLRKRTT